MAFIHYYGPVAENPDGFNPVWYLQKYPDVCKECENPSGWLTPLGHWLKWGRLEKRIPYDPGTVIDEPAKAPIAKPTKLPPVTVKIGASHKGKI
jgi:hypothetical protein